jgi:FecR protein
MLTKLLSHLLLSLSTVTFFYLPLGAIALTPLTKAEIQKLHNIVQFIPKDNLNKRPARQLDIITPGDGVSTGRSSLVDLRFNDGSLARLGEQAVFKFVPKERNFQLSNGTVLLLIPPGQGQTQIKTPNAVAAIRGSALFVRYNQTTDTTIIGALTNSGIQVFNQEASQNHVLEAGQLMVVVEGKFQGLYDFDLRSFYETSDLVKGLNLINQTSNIGSDPVLADVQAEINAALISQPPITGKGVIENPSFVQNSSNDNKPPKPELTRENLPDNTKNNFPVESFIEQGQVILKINQSSGNNNGVNGNSDGVQGGGNNNTSGGNNNGGNGNSDGVQGGGNNNTSGGNNNGGNGNSDGVPGGGNNNNSGGNNNGGNGNSDGVPGGGNDNNPGNSDKDK